METAASTCQRMNSSATCDRCGQGDVDSCGYVMTLMAMRLPTPEKHKEARRRIEGKAYCTSCSEAVANEIVCELEGLKA